MASSSSSGQPSGSGCSSSASIVSNHGPRLAGCSSHGGRPSCVLDHMILPMSRLISALSTAGGWASTCCARWRSVPKTASVMPYSGLRSSSRLNSYVLHSTRSA